ncbi:MAG TPA: DUF5681 domain-containing protein [Terriglobia bacterium]|nr:DUF5681 domain-containing protein [Terriglobia bacterium]
MATSTNAIQRASGRWAKGESGNPAGRPVGSVNHSHTVLRQLLVANSESVIAAVIKAAESGDMTAARIILDRVLPKRLCRPLDGLVLPAISNVADACKAMEAITNAVLAGVMSAEEGAHLSTVVETYRRTIEVAEVVARVERLERLQAPKSSASKRLAGK